MGLPSISHKNAAVAGPPQRNACQRKSRIGSMTAHNGESNDGKASAQKADSMLSDFEFLYGKYRRKNQYVNGSPLQFNEYAYFFLLLGCQVGSGQDVRTNLRPFVVILLDSWNKAPFVSLTGSV